jgi:hypothetical protein
MAAGTMNISIPAKCAELGLLAMGAERGPSKASHIIEIMESARRLGTFLLPNIGDSVDADVGQIKHAQPTDDGLLALPRAQ